MNPEHQPTLQLEMRGIRKAYGAVQANRGIDLEVKSGQIVGLLGENGSGKSTLMKVLFGIVSADAGTIRFKGEPLTGHGPAQAMAAGLGMIHQHFTLVEAMSVTENVMLGTPGSGPLLSPRETSRRIAQESATYGLDIDPNAIIADLPHGRRQRVEIVKAILRGADLLILDEPTSNLSPPEVESLLAIMARLRDQGCAIVFISHKLDEVLAICSDIVVLRDGAVAGTCTAAGATRADLAKMMVARQMPPPVARDAVVAGRSMLHVVQMALTENGIARLAPITFSLRAGEILAIAGIDGNGQSELVECLAGLRTPTAGGIDLDGQDVTFASVSERTASGLAYIPVDRASTSLVTGMSVSDNLALRDFDRMPLSRHGWLKRGSFADRAMDMAQRFAIKSAGPDVAVRTLSGGNQQKIVLAREIGRQPIVLIAHQPVWGLDPGATRFVIDQILALRAAGGAILYISSSLEEVMTLGDRIAVMQGGRLSPPIDRDEVDITQIGLMMAGDTAAIHSHAA
jgi:simple sugar transport system ATP-binding protein